MRRTARTAARTAAVVATAAVLGLSQLPAQASPVPSAAPGADVRAKLPPGKQRTPFAFSATAWGSRAEGGMLPVDSATTAYKAIGCTNVAGKSGTNRSGDLTLPGLGTAEGVVSRTWTTRKGRFAQAAGTHSIARIKVVDTPLGSLQIRGLSSTSKAFSRSGRLGTSFTSEVAKIVLKPAVGPEQVLAIPAPGQPVVVPGLVRLEVGRTVRHVTDQYAEIRGNALDVTVIPTDTRVRVGQSSARIERGVRSGMFAGFSAGLEASGLAGNVRAGRQPLSIMPCLGTRGEHLGKDVGGLDLAGQVVARGVSSRQRASNGARRAWGVERGQVSHLELAGGRVVINGIVGIARVARTPDGVEVSSEGSTVAEIVVDGETHTIPKAGPLEIPGLVRIDDVVTRELRNGSRVIGLKVIGLQVTLLDGTGAVIDLGIAQLAVRPGAL